MSNIGPNVLTIDIEMFPNVGHIWSLWKQNVSISQLQESSRVASFAAKWYGQKKIIFKSEFHHGKEEMLKSAHDLLDQADWVVGYNSESFDVPHLNSEFVDVGLPHYSPIKHIDLLKSVKKTFRFPSNKLDYVAQRLGVGQKIEHEGHELWVKCLAGNTKAWDRFRKYNIHDVRITEKLYDSLLPWLQSLPNMGLFVESNDPVCPKCGSKHVQKRGFAYTAVSKFQQFSCQDCGAWSRGRASVIDKDERPNILSEVK